MLAGINGAGKSSFLGSLLEQDGATWFNPDSFTRDLVAGGYTHEAANSAAWKEGVRRLQQALASNRNYAFETTLGANTIPRLLRQACDQHEVTVWFCGLSTPELHIARVAARVAAGGHDIPEARIRARYDSSRANLIGLLAHLHALHVYDNSQPSDANGEVEPALVLEMDRERILYPVSAEDIAQTPGWAKPIAMAAIEARGGSQFVAGTRPGMASTPEP